MKNIIAENINWESIGKHDIGEYEFVIGKTSIDPVSRVLTVNISLNFVMPYFDMKKVKTNILSNIDGLNDLKFVYHYENLILSPAETVRLFVPHMIHTVNGEFKSITQTIQFNNIELQEDKVVVYAVGKVATEKLNEHVSPLFSKLLKENFEIETKFEFVNNEVDYKKVMESIEKVDMAQQKELETQLQNNNKRESSIAPNEEKNKKSGKVSQTGKSSNWQSRRNNSKKRERPAEGNRLYGEIIETKPISFTDVRPEAGIVTVEGELFKIDERVLKTGNMLVNFIITNGRMSLQCKAFMGEEKLEELKRIMTPGTGVIMKGQAQINKFDNNLEIMLSDINLGKPIEKKKETYQGEDKRVELHCHSKMSQMDGLNEPERMVMMAAEWGQKAIAITDHGVVQAYPDMAAAAQKAEKKTGNPIKIIYGLEGYVLDDSDLIDEEGNIAYKAKGTNHIIILAKNQAGIKSIYKLVSDSHLKYFYRKPRIPWSLLNENRENLIIGSACEAGELYRAIVQDYDEDKIEEIANRYDYLEIQPLTNNKFMIDSGMVSGEEELKEINRRIVNLADKLNKPIVATTDAHYEDENSAVYRNIIMAGMGYKDVESGTQGLYLRTTAEMLEEFSYLGEDMAKKVVIDNTNLIADMIDADMKPVPDGKYPPKIENAENTLRETCYEKAYSIYGNPLPKPIDDRLKKELDSIIGNGYAVMYVSAQMLVNKSMQDGYLVGSRGSVGSSFAATMAGITEVNPLAPHYICHKCKHLEWGDQNKYDCGCDMPEKICPECGEKMAQDGYTIPFETFLGFTGNKEPDIDLNFAGEYQATAHKYVGEIFGEKNVYKAGTVGTVAAKTAAGFVKKFYEAKDRAIDRYEVERLSQGCEGVRRTTGQHPGGIVIVPDDHDILEFCPVQHPANDTKSDIITTHFDYHKIDSNLLKLDILGHDGPSMIRQLQDMTGVSPFEIPFKDENVMSIFTSIDALKIQDEANYLFHQGSLGIPEFGTSFTRQMLDDTDPKRFADLVRISGFSHGTDVWLNNAQDYIRSGQATMSEVISTRDDIMNYLILKGLPKPDAFGIMENVRKGSVAKGKFKPTESCKNWDDATAMMKEHEVADWYIESCAKIKYMFPRAHAVAYVMTSWRMAWFKVYYPNEFYATYFTTKVTDFDIPSAFMSVDELKEAIQNLTEKARSKMTTKKDEDRLTIMEVIYEMRARGYEFAPARFGKSKSAKFTVDDGKVRIPFEALEGVGENAALSIVEAYDEKPFTTVEDVQNRCKVTSTALELLREHGVLDGLPETEQFNMFTMF